MPLKRMWKLIAAVVSKLILMTLIVQESVGTFLEYSQQQQKIRFKKPNGQFESYVIEAIH